MFLLLLGVISCQNNNRNAKSDGKPAKKPNSQVIEMIQDGPEDVPNPALAGAGDSSKETNSGGRGTAQQSASVNKPVDKMMLHFLKNTLVTCNDGTAAGAWFAPSCLSHTLITKSNWMDFQIKGTLLSRALQCWGRRLQEAIKNSKTPLKGCPFHLIDNCQWPQCNPTCPALIDQATQQEMTLLQVLSSMGLDLQKLGLDVSRDISARMVSSGG
ncbi:hypothetical protein cypCar_00044585 [Cyprinus carpio]|nr:hypothetical protein cypCar_00044585 [Cyprinus carpio]